MEEQNFSRVARNRQKSNRILNILIGVVFVLIVITAASIFTGGDDRAADRGNEAGTEQTGGGSGPDGGKALADEGGEDSDAAGDDKSEDGETAAEEKDSGADKGGDEPQESDQPGKVIRTPSESGVVDETIVDTSWKPIGTKQSGEHVSVYEKGHIDWQEKVKAMSYATGIPESDMIVWYVKNGGGPQKSIGTVSTGDKSEKYNVHLEWVDGEGWMPVRLDKLNKLEGAY
ncbi:YrrS family protein [Bhargavaea beijingensis]|uniref:DUF1510 family protein n=1 Tax=Bhargavaea beijingensis TaxID=426756 RepID=A0A1G7CMT4_9BACL|nr:DUF1510 family protein [Bhargavaea beijingensis]MCW1927049.1 DUF1510 family protein [Bhargavaea beijingensis]RSK30779.1 DUF1510 family protein [Bhargavaea beijingensis]SDE40658.1 Protein of unknown function [Bhargavaea beijingensis]